MRPCRLFVTGERTDVTFSPAPIRIMVSILHNHHHHHPILRLFPFWIFRRSRTNHHHRPPPPLRMTKKNELVATARFKERKKMKEKTPAVPVQRKKKVKQDVPWEGKVRSRQRNERGRRTWIVSPRNRDRGERRLKMADLKSLFLKDYRV